MLRYFRINDPYRLLGLLVILLLIYLPVFMDQPSLTNPELKTMLVGEKVSDGFQMYKEVADNTAPLAAWFHALMDILFDRSLLARHIVAFVIIFFQSTFFGIILITKKVFNENTFIPSFLFSILFFFSFDTISLTDELLGSGFLLLALNNLFKEIEFRMPRDETSFNLGFFISLASLFFLAYSIFLAAVLIILFLFSRTNLRKILLVVFGFLLPHFAVLSISYMNGGLNDIIDYYYLSNLSFIDPYIVPIRSIFILGLLPVIYLAISIVMLNRLARFSKYQAELLQSIFLWGGFCFIFFLFSPDMRPQSFIVLIPVLAILFTHLLLLIRRKKFAEMNVWILLLGIVSISYLARYNKLSSVDYTNLFVGQTQPSVKGQKILVLSDDRRLYAHNHASTPFINWSVTKDIFAEPEYFESVGKVYEGLTLDPPDVIIDKDNLMKPFLGRMPKIKSEYERVGEQYVRRKTSN